MRLDYTVTHGIHKSQSMHHKVAVDAPPPPHKLATQPRHNLLPPPSLSISVPILKRKPGSHSHLNRLWYEPAVCASDVIAVIQPLIFLTPVLLKWLYRRRDDELGYKSQNEGVVVLSW